MSEGFTRGEFARVPLIWNDSTKTLTIGAREGNYAGMTPAREISVRIYSPAEQLAPDSPDGAPVRVKYEGKKVTVRMKGIEKEHD